MPSQNNHDLSIVSSGQIGVTNKIIIICGWVGGKTLSATLSTKTKEDTRFHICSHVIHSFRRSHFRTCLPCPPYTVHGSCSCVIDREPYFSANSAIWSVERGEVHFSDVMQASTARRCVWVERNIMKVLVLPLLVACVDTYLAIRWKNYQMAFSPTAPSWLFCK